MNKLISIIIVNYNGKKWLKKCFNSLTCQTYRNFEIIFVDNGSIDGSIEFVKDNYKDDRVKIIKSDKNLGFAGGNNLGIKNSGGKYLLLLNNDTQFKNDFLEKLYSYLIESRLDVVAPREADYNGNPLPYAFNRTIDIFGHPFFLKNKTKNIFYLQGICLLLSRRIYELTGGLDSDFFMYFEETDWFWRLNLLNKKFGIKKDVFVHHAGSGTAGKGIQYNTFLWRNQNTLQMLLKNYSWYSLVWVLPIYFLQNIAEIFFFFFMFRPKISLSYIQGWLFNIVNINRTLRKRKWIQNNRLVADGEIIGRMYFGFGKIDHLFNYFRIKL